MPEPGTDRVFFLIELDAPLPKTAEALLDRARPTARPAAPAASGAAESDADASSDANAKQAAEILSGKRRKRGDGSDDDVALVFAGKGPSRRVTGLAVGIKQYALATSKPQPVTLGGGLGTVAVFVGDGVERVPKLVPCERSLAFEEKKGGEVKREKEGEDEEDEGGGDKGEG